VISRGSSFPQPLLVVKLWEERLTPCAIRAKYRQTNQMDLFLSYNSTDHSLVENIARGLCGAGLKPFLDRWNLALGVRWRSKLEETLVSCRAVAVFLGPGEMGPWQQREVDVALDLQSRNRNFPVIPVLLRAPARFSSSVDLGGPAQPGVRSRNCNFGQSRSRGGIGSELQT
jgi:hypothetical protein